MPPYFTMCLFLVFLLFVNYVRLSSCGIPSTSASSVSSFDKNYYNTWGFQHFLRQNKGTQVQLSIDQNSGSGFMSKRRYGSGLFGMRIKIPKKHSLGIITAFYLTSLKYNEPYGNHNEIDFEFLGGNNGMPYTLQTNVFSNDNGGREERVALWFDPTADFHSYQILWNQYHIVFYVDNIPIRVFRNNRRIGVKYPSGGMSIVASLWSDSTWAAHGKKIRWSDAPFLAYFSGFEINGCRQIKRNRNNCAASKYYWWNGPNYRKLDRRQAISYLSIRQKYLTYSYCFDRAYLHPECPKRTLLP